MFVGPPITLYTGVPTITLKLSLGTTVTYQHINHFSMNSIHQKYVISLWDPKPAPFSFGVQYSLKLIELVI